MTKSTYLCIIYYTYLLPTSSFTEFPNSLRSVPLLYQLYLLKLRRQDDLLDFLSSEHLWPLNFMFSWEAF